MEISKPSGVSEGDSRASGAAATMKGGAGERIEAKGFEDWSEKESEGLGLGEAEGLQTGRRESITESEDEAAMASGDKQRALG